MPGQWEPLQSTFITGALYIEDRQELNLRMGGRVYTFENVPQNIYEGLMEARSAGDYYHKNIKGIYGG